MLLLLKGGLFYSSFPSYTRVFAVIVVDIVIVIVVVVVVVVDAAVVVAAVLFALLLLHPRCCFPLFIPHAHTVYYTAMKCESMGGP